MRSFELARILAGKGDFAVITSTRGREPEPDRGLSRR
jgi:hypothetical protein